MKKRILSMMLALVMVVGLLPTTAFAVSSTGNFTVNSTKAATTEIVYGGQNWYVIGANGNGVASESGTMTLLVKDMCGYEKFDKTSPYSKAYSGSNLKTMVDQLAEVNNGSNGGLFTQAEQNAISPRTLTDVAPQVDNAILWPLSNTEAGSVSSEDLRKIGYDWWLRSPGNSSTNVALVNFNGMVTMDGSYVGYGNNVRLAFKLKLSSVLFASAAAGGKAGNASANLTAVTAPSGVQKLTMLDNSLSLAVDDKTSITKGKGESFSIAYSGATVGSNNYVSCLIEQNGAVKFYGKLAAASANNGTATINLPADIPIGSYTIKMFCENINADYITDYASVPVEIPLVVPAAYTATVTVNKDDQSYSSGTPTLKLSTSDATLAGELTGTASNGVVYL